jgi:hypothetical protein
MKKNDGVDQEVFISILNDMVSEELTINHTDEFYAEMIFKDRMFEVRMKDGLFIIDKEELDMADPCLFDKIKDTILLFKHNMWMLPKKGNR